MGNTNYHYFQFKEKHIKDAQYIFKNAFNYIVSESFIKNKYDTSHLGIESISTIAYDKDKPIAFYGAIPQLFTNKKESFLIAHACDSYTLSEYQKQGLHYNLALKSYEIMQQNNVKMVYAFHSENTFYSTKKLNWKEHENLVRFHIKTKNISSSKIYNKLGFNNILHTKALKLLRPYLIENTKNPFFKTNFFHQKYHSEFYNYKNGFNNHFLIEIEGCIFYLKFNSIINVGFFDFDTEQNFKLGIEKLKILISKIGFNEILFQVNFHSKQHDALLKIARPFPSWLVGYLSFDEKINISEFRFNFADLDTF
ncbi:MAG: GNAT family N-acetyltransferase [Flavobacteriales bacterium]|nr:GNAT family N-acetyltransferase [Flavobacteriales bacterium]